MAFMKTNAALSIQNISHEDAQTLMDDSFPLDPKLGDVHEGFIWDGGAWVTLESWASRQVRDDAEA